MAILSFSISIEVFGSWLAIVLLYALSLLIVQMHWLESKVRVQIDHIIEIQCPSSINDTDCYNIEEECPWTEGDHYALWVEFYEGMDEDALMNLDNYRDRDYAILFICSLP